MRRNRRLPRLILASTIALTLCACVSPPSCYEGRPPHDCEAEIAMADKDQVVSGRPIWILDNAGSWLWPESLLAKLILWNRRIDDHKVNPEQVEVLEAYLEANHLHQVKVRLNGYAPIGEWKRLWRNKRMHWFWRGTFGMLTWISYTIQPGRFFGGDHFNPYTNTVNLYSSDIYVALHEVGHAKDDALTDYPGLYSLARVVPGVDLYQEANASRDAINYLWTYDTPEHVAEAHRTLYPAYGTYIGGFVTQFLPYPPLELFYVQLGSVLVGHGVAAYTAGVVEENAGEPESYTAVSAILR